MAGITPLLAHPSWVILGYENSHLHSESPLRGSRTPSPAYTQTAAPSFSDALREYLARHAPNNITEGMDQTLGVSGEGMGKKKDLFVSFAARGSLEQTEW
jgi:hypothetical protein